MLRNEHVPVQEIILTVILKYSIQLFDQHVTSFSLSETVTCSHHLR
jgi:hypothetical protein